MNRVIKNDTFVQVGEGPRIPLRYQNRTGFVVGRTGKGTQVKYLVDFSPRRATPLPVSPSQLTPLA